MRARHLLLAASLAAVAAGCGGDSGTVTGAEGTSYDASRGRSVLVDGLTYTQSGDRLSIADGAAGGYVRGWASPALSGQGYPMGIVPASGYEALWMLERPGYQGRLEAIAFSPRCAFSRWIIGLNTVSTSAYVTLQNYPGSSSFVAEFICTA